MENIIIDDMKKESKHWKVIMVWGYFLALTYPFGNYIQVQHGGGIDKFEHVIFISLAFFLMGSFGLYGWIILKKYHLIITDDKIKLNTLFVKKEWETKNVIRYTYKKNKKTTFYSFEIYTAKGKILIITHYYKELIDILEVSLENNKERVPNNN